MFLIGSFFKCNIFFQVDVMACDAGILISDGGADGVVLGCLDVEGNIDQDGCKTILKSLPSSKVVSKNILQLAFV